MKAATVKKQRVTMKPGHHNYYYRLDLLLGFKGKIYEE